MSKRLLSKEENGSLAEKLSKTNAENERLRAAISRQDEEIVKQKDHYHKLVEEVSRLTQEVTKTKLEYSDAKIEIARLTAELLKAKKIPDVPSAAADKVGGIRSQKLATPTASPRSPAQRPDRAVSPIVQPAEGDEERTALRSRVDQLEAERRSLLARIEHLELDRRASSSSSKGGADDEKRMLQEVVRQLQETVAIKDGLIEKATASRKLAESRLRMSESDLTQRAVNAEAERDRLQGELERLHAKLQEAGPSPAANAPAAAAGLEGQVNMRRGSFKLQGQQDSSGRYRRDMPIRMALPGESTVNKDGGSGSHHSRDRPPSATESTVAPPPPGPETPPPTSSSSKSSAFMSVITSAASLLPSAGSFKRSSRSASPNVSASPDRHAVPVRQPLSATATPSMFSCLRDQRDPNSLPHTPINDGNPNVHGAFVPIAPPPRSSPHPDAAPPSPRATQSSQGRDQLAANLNRKTLTKPLSTAPISNYHSVSEPRSAVAAPHSGGRERRSSLSAEVDSAPAAAALAAVAPASARPPESAPEGGSVWSIPKSVVSFLGLGRKDRSGSSSDSGSANSSPYGAPDTRGKNAAVVVSSDIGKRLTKTVSAGKGGTKIGKDVLTRLGVFTLASLVADGKLSVSTLQNSLVAATAGSTGSPAPGTGDAKVYLVVASSDLLTVVLPSGLAASDRVLKRSLRSVQRWWASLDGSPPSAGKVYQLSDLTEPHLDAMLDRARYAFGVHIDRTSGTFPHTCYVYAVSVPAAEFDTRVVRLPEETSQRWALRTPSKKPLLLVVVDADSAAANGTKAPGDVLSLELTRAVKDKVRLLRGFHVAWTHYLGVPPPDDENSPLLSLLWTRKGSFLPDGMLEKERDPAARVPLKAQNASEMMRLLGFVEGKTLGRGGFSSVFSCTRNGIPYALKIQRIKEWKEKLGLEADKTRGGDRDSELDGLLLVECKVNRLLNTLDWLKKSSPNFIRMRDWYWCPSDGAHIQVLDRCDMTLTQFLECFEESQPAGFLVALRGIVAQLCIAMHHARTTFNFTHADFKAHNVLLQFHPLPRTLFPELSDHAPTQPLNRRWLRYLFLDEHGAPQSFIFDLALVPLAQIADFGRSRMVLETDERGGSGEPAVHAHTKLFEMHDLRFLVFDLLWRTERLRVRPLQQLFNNQTACQILEAMIGKPLSELKRRAGSCARAEDAMLREVFGKEPEVTPLEALRHPCFAPDHRFSVEGVDHTYSNTATYVSCPTDETVRGLWSGKHL